MPGRHRNIWHRAQVPWWRRFGTVRLRALFALGVVGVLAATGTTFAAWTDSATVTGTTVTAGTIDLKVQNLDTVTGYTTLNLATMVPGNSVAAVLTIKNGGTASLKYTATSASTNADGKGLAAALTLKVTGDAAVTGTSPSATCAGTALTGTGTTLGGSLVTTGRLLAAGASESLCIQIALPTTALSALQGGTTNITLGFNATSDLS
jgi:predicted ribosomally synthesized peptide with SipW-like signal peptide